jgi:putative aldouronate transport system permease protein
MLSTIGLFVAVGQWNNWFTPMLFLNERHDWPLALLLRDILVVNNTDFVRNGGIQPQRQLLSNSIKAAVAIVSILPIVAVYPFIQKYFVKGVMIGAVKS